jgi:CVNH domain
MFCCTTSLTADNWSMFSVRYVCSLTANRIGITNFTGISVKRALTPLFALSVLQSIGPTAEAEVDSRAQYPGSYRTSCLGIYGTPGFLQAECRSGNGNLKFTRLDQPRLCVGDIENDDGRLKCTRRKETVPVGSYRSSCRKARVFQGSLYAECTDDSGSYRSSFLNEYHLCSGDVSNNNGYLRCN